MITVAIPESIRMKRLILLAAACSLLAVSSPAFARHHHHRSHHTIKTTTGETSHGVGPAKSTATGGEAGGLPSKN